MFTFESSSSEVASEMKSKIKATAYGWSAKGEASRSVDKSSSIDSAMLSLQIQIFGFGLGLDKDGSETLVATVSLELFILTPYRYDTNLLNIFFSSFLHSRLKNTTQQ